MNIQDFPIDDIKLKSEYLRLDTSTEELENSIKAVGLINPLILNSQDELIAGARRYTALKNLGYSEAPIVRVEKNELEQELISIDENLMRLDLNKLELEKSLNRGRVLYEQLYPTATKLDDEDLTKSENQQIQADKPKEHRSYVDITAEKTGLSKKVLKQAIQRDVKSSDKVKELRQCGELNATQTNELIKLSADDQEKAAELIKSKSSKEIKDFVKKVHQYGIDKAYDQELTTPKISKEYKALFTLLKRTKKVALKIQLEEMLCTEDKKDELLAELKSLEQVFFDLRELNGQLDMMNSMPHNQVSESHMGNATL